MLSYLFFGAPGEGIIDPPVADGHRGVNVLIDGQVLQVDLDILAEASGLFLQVQLTNAEEVPLEDFPGNIVVFRQIVAMLTGFGDAARLKVTDDNVLSLFEAAWLLECPRVFDEVMGSSYMHSLSSRRKVELLEHLLPFTAASSPTESHGFLQDGLPTEDGDPTTAIESDEFMRIFLLETSMWQRTERAAVELVAQLDTGDFVLGPRLVTGSLRVCCEILRLYQKREQEMGFVTSALQPVSAIWKNITDKPLRAKVSWDVHLFALQCMRRRLLANKDLAGEHDEDLEAKADIPDYLCAAVDDRILFGLVELVDYVDLGRAQPNWMALLVRTLLLRGKKGEARWAFATAFPQSQCVQLLAWRGTRTVPVAWLSDVAENLEASRVLLRVLGRYQEMDVEDFCSVIEDVLLASFLSSKHCALIVLPSELINDIVGACFDAGRKARAPQSPQQLCADFNAQSCTGSNDTNSSNMHEDRCPRHWAGQQILWRLQHLGTRLFAAAFVAQRGFLPHKWPDCLDPTLGYVDTSAEHGIDSRVAEDIEPLGRCDQQDHFCPLEPRVVRVVGTCLWDEGLLQIDLLHSIMDAGRASPHEPILHFGRQVIMRHLWFTCQGSYCEVPRLKALWGLACWPLCEDPGLIREALEYLKGTYRELLAFKAGWCPDYEEAIFHMFAALDLVRLTGQALVSPWVPSQVQMVRLLVQQQPSEQFHAELHQEVVTSMESLRSINASCSKLSNQLNIVEQRTVINKSQINDAILVSEEHQRRRREAALPPRRVMTMTGK